MNTIRNYADKIGLQHFRLEEGIAFVYMGEVMLLVKGEEPEFFETLADTGTYAFAVDTDTEGIKLLDTFKLNAGVRISAKTKHLLRAMIKAPKNFSLVDIGISVGTSPTYVSRLVRICDFYKLTTHNGFDKRKRKFSVTRFGRYIALYQEDVRKV